MRKNASILLLLLIARACLFALDIGIAPLSYIRDGQDTRGSSGTEYASLLEGHLSSRSSGQYFGFSSLTKRGLGTPVSVFDALSLCEGEGKDLLLYGYVQDTGPQTLCELKLLDFESKKIITTFYGADTTDMRERMFSDLGVKVVTYLNGRFGLPPPTEPLPPDNLLVRSPLMLGYWTPLGEAWCSVMLGTVSVFSGIEYIPDDLLAYVFGKEVYGATGLEVNYRLGIGNPSQYSAYLHGVELTVPLRAYMRITDIHEAYVGLGLAYASGAFLFQDSYSPSETATFSAWGYSLSAGYRANVFTGLSLCFDLTMRQVMHDRTLVTLSPSIGISHTFIEKELTQ
jgi:hypothetical protein